MDSEFAKLINHIRTAEDAARIVCDHLMRYEPHAQQTGDVLSLQLELHTLHDQLLSATDFTPARAARVAQQLREIWQRWVLEVTPIRPQEP